MIRAVRVRDRGEVERRHEADALLERAGDFVLVRRGVLRSFAMRCPDGCGDTLTINLDPRSGKAWRFYRKQMQASLFPSVWRDTGCRSHFIIWSHTVVWCGGRRNDAEVPRLGPADLRKRVLNHCDATWRHFAAIADDLQEVPWDVNRECEDLVKCAGLLVEGAGDLRGHFRLRNSGPTS